VSQFVTNDALEAICDWIGWKRGRSQPHLAFAPSDAMGGTVEPVVTSIAATFDAAAADEPARFHSRVPERHVPPCTALIETPGLTPARRARAFALRGQSYLQRGQYLAAVRDYDEAIRISPQFAAHSITGLSPILIWASRS
jgi:tetratricopeptide (TPR) repeat protein